MKKSIFLLFLIALFVTSSFASHLIYKGTLVRKDLYDYAPSESIAIPANFSQIRVVIVRTTEPLARPSSGRPGFAASVDADFESAHFLLATASTDYASTSFLIDTPPPSITVTPKNQIGTFAIFVWGSE